MHSANNCLIILVFLFFENSNLLVHSFIVCVVMDCEQDLTRRLGQLQKQVEHVSTVENGRSNTPPTLLNASTGCLLPLGPVASIDRANSAVDCASEHGSEQQSGDSASMSDVEVIFFRLGSWTWSHNFCLEV